MGGSGAAQAGLDAMAPAGQVTVGALRELLDAFNRHDLERIMEFFSDDATFDKPRGPHPWGVRYSLDSVRDWRSPIGRDYGKAPQHRKEPGGCRALLLS